MTTYANDKERIRESQELEEEGIERFIMGDRLDIGCLRGIYYVCGNYGCEA